MRVVSQMVLVSSHWMGAQSVRVMKDVGRAERVLETMKGFVGFGAPGQRLRLATQHGDEGRCEPTEPVDETSIEVGKP